METINFIGILAAVWLFTTGASVVQEIKNILELGNLSNPKNLALKLIRKLINCSMCTGFWVGLAYYQNFLMACIVSIASEIFTRLLTFIFNRI
jgi:hypothetical protein